METYVMLYNVETKKEKKEALDFLNIMPEAKLVQYGIMGRKGDEKEILPNHYSLWVPKEKFMVAWTYFNHASLKRHDVDFDSGNEYFQIQSNDNDYMKTAEVLNKDLVQ